MQVSFFGTQCRLTCNYKNCVTVHNIVI